MWSSEFLFISSWILCSFYSVLCVVIIVTSCAYTHRNLQCKSSFTHRWGSRTCADMNSTSCDMRNEAVCSTWPLWEYWLNRIFVRSGVILTCPPAFVYGCSLRNSGWSVMHNCKSYMRNDEKKRNHIHLIVAEKMFFSLGNGRWTLTKNQFQQIFTFRTMNNRHTPGSSRSPVSGLINFFVCVDDPIEIITPVRRLLYVRKRWLLLAVPTWPDSAPKPRTHERKWSDRIEQMC